VLELLSISRISHKPKSKIKIEAFKSLRALFDSKNEIEIENEE